MFSLRYRELLPSGVEMELDAFYKRLRAIFLEEHNEDGTHVNAYTTGTWLPIIGGATSTSGQTYGVQGGFWIKHGDLVTAWGRVAFTNIGTLVGNAEIQGLPFSSLPGATRGIVHFGVFDSISTAVVSMQGYTNTGTTTASIFHRTGAAGSATATTAAVLGNSADLAFTVTYKSS